MRDHILHRYSIQPKKQGNKKSGREVGQDLKKVRLSNGVFKKIKGVRTGGHGKTSS